MLLEYQGSLFMIYQWLSIVLRLQPEALVLYKEVEMLAKQRCYTLKNNENVHANIVVIPTGMIEVDLVEENQHLTSDFDHIHFKGCRQGIQLICEDCDCETHKEVSLTLSRKDAFELCTIIDDAIEEYEELMKDL